MSPLTRVFANETLCWYHNLVNLHVIIDMCQFTRHRGGSVLVRSRNDNDDNDDNDDDDDNDNDNDNGDANNDDDD